MYSWMPQWGREADALRHPEQSQAWEDAWALDILREARKGLSAEAPT